MSQVTLKSKDSESIEPLIVSALQSEKNEIETGILKTKEKLLVFEKKYTLSTTDFVNTPSTSLQISELEAIEWSGEYETLKHLEMELSRLIKIEICS